MQSTTALPFRPPTCKNESADVTRGRQMRSNETVDAGRAIEEDDPKGPEATALAGTVIDGRHAFASATSSVTLTGLCAADWRKADEYWRCTRPVGHQGRHRLRQLPSDQRDDAAPLVQSTTPDRTRRSGRGRISQRG
jgi:hypothetical protein